MIRLDNEGYYFVSSSGIRYCLYEGNTFGGKQIYTSDTIFIMLADDRYYDKVKTHFVNYYMGLSFFEKDMEEYNEALSDFIMEYEKENNIYREIETIKILPSGRTKEQVLIESLEKLRDIYMIDHEVMENDQKVKLLENIVDLRVIIEGDK